VRALVREAGQRMDRGDRAGAAALLQQAQALSPDPSLDYNLGVVYAEMAQHPQAAAALQRFVQTADRSAVLSDRLEDAQRRLDTYQRTLARLSVKATLPAGARSPSLVPSPVPSLIVDQQEPRPLPLPQPLWLLPGEHRVRVSAEDARPYEVTVDLTPGQPRELFAELLPPAALSSVVPVTAELQHAHDSAQQPPLYKKWWFWTAIGGGAVAVIGLSLIGAGASGRLNHVAAGSDLDPVDVAR
jgi:hypothetical protein